MSELPTLEQESMGAAGAPEMPNTGEVNPSPSLPSFTIPEWLKAETGSGAVEDYVDHVLNFKKSKGLARIIRGLTGIFQHGLNFAVLDIIMGALEFSKERVIPDAKPD